MSDDTQDKDLTMTFAVPCKCGGRAIVRTERLACYRWDVSCGNNDCMRAAGGSSREEAVRRWNEMQRAAEPASGLCSVALTEEEHAAVLWLADLERDWDSAGLVGLLRRLGVRG